MFLFHGSYAEIQKPDVHFSRKRLDFGQGFYLAKDYLQAEKWAQRYKYRKLPSVVNVYRLDMETVEKQYRVKVFESYDKEWLQFIIQNREGSAENKYDIIIGGIANDKVFNTIELFQNGLINEEETLGRLKYEKPNWQMCICNQEILDLYLEFQKSEEIMNGSE